MSFLSVVRGWFRAGDRLCAYDHCRLPLPWFVWSRRADPASRLRRHILALDYGRPLETAGNARTILAAGLHFFRGTREILILWHRCRGACRQGYGVGGGRQLAELFSAAFRYNFPPALYYASRLFRLERGRWAAVFSHGETTLLLATFEQATQHLNLWTKSGWAAFGRTWGLAGVPLAGRVSNGELVIEEAVFLQPGRDLFLKPDRDYSGIGGVMLEWDVTAVGWRALGAVTALIPGDGLRAFLRQHTRGGSFVLQPRLRNAASLADLAARALVNARIVTLRTAGGNISVLMAALRMPPGEQPTSDVVGHTLCAPIDPETGRLGAAECAQLQLGACARHPFNGAMVEGRMLSAWAQMREQAVAAHRLIPSMPSIGWDLVATDDGVFILEANAVWNGYLAQHWGRTPLGETAWPALMLAALDARPA